MQGLNALPVTIEVDTDERSSTPHFSIVGLPDSAVKESQERVQAAVRAQGFTLPPRSTVVNLAPADVRKEGSGFDLPMALGYMITIGYLQVGNLSRFMFVGELSLDGSIQPVRGALPIAIMARAQKYEALFVPG